MTQKIVINDELGGFCFPDAAIDWITANYPDYKWPKSSDEVKRDDPAFVAAVEALGEAVEPLAIVEIPDGVEWCIKDYDGAEWVAEKHRVWGTGGELEN